MRGRGSLCGREGRFRDAPKSSPRFCECLLPKVFDLPDGYDLALLANLGDGVVVLDILRGRCTWDRIPIPLLERCAENRKWLERQIRNHHFNIENLKAASMTVEFRVKDYVFEKAFGHESSQATFWFKCTSEIRTDEALYQGIYEGEKTWGYTYDKLYALSRKIRILLTLVKSVRVMARFFRFMSRVQPPG
jgi:hypothetical protein